jgi:hypothetical protein
VFNLSCHSGFMDLGFARRRNAHQSAKGVTSELTRLLADIAARQAVSPTAQAEIRASLAEDPLLSAHPEIENFAPRADRKTVANAVASFSPDVSETLVTHGKPL